MTDSNIASQEPVSFESRLWCPKSRIYLKQNCTDCSCGYIPSVGTTAPASPLLPGLEPVVDFYEREFYPLSNFSAFKLLWHGHTFETSEAAYQWTKFAGCRNDICHLICTAQSAHEAFKIAEEWKDVRRPNWDQIKVMLMRDILYAKTQQHEYVRRKLLETGTRTLVECSWRDDFWGWGPNRDGQNMLGKLWMEIRSEISRLKGEGSGE